MRRLLQFGWSRFLQTPPAFTSASQSYQGPGRHLLLLTAGLPSRAFASSSPDVDEANTAVYNKAVRDYEAALSGLRRKWEGERKEAARVKAERMAKREERWQAAVASRKARREEWKARKAQQLATEQEQLQAEKAKHREKTARWRQAVESVYSIHQRRRHKALMGQSRSWIRPEELDARIEAALDSPLQLGADWVPPLPPTAAGSMPAGAASTLPDTHTLAWDSSGAAQPASSESGRDANGKAQAARGRPGAGSMPTGAKPQDSPAAEVLGSGGTPPVSSVEPEAAAAQDAARMMPPWCRTVM